MIFANTPKFAALSQARDNWNLDKNLLCMSGAKEYIISTGFLSVTKS